MKTRRRAGRRKANRLTKLFDDFNAQYFGGELARYRVEATDRITRSGEDGKIYRRRQLIRIRRGSEAEMTATLLHEMAHASTNDHHGRRWREEMVRLHDLGAPVAPADLEEPVVRRLTRGFVEATASDALGDQPTLTFQQFATWFAYQYTGYSKARLLRTYPWIRSVFAQAKRRVKRGEPTPGHT